MKLILLILFSLLSGALSAQHKPSSRLKTTMGGGSDSLVQQVIELKRSGKWQFPITAMWDDALAKSKISGRPTIAFNVDYIDSLSIKFRDEILQKPIVQIFLSKNFELAINDFSIDPPPSVGFDSLRNLGRRLDGLEKGYSIAVRPTAIILQPDGLEVERIALTNISTPEKFIIVTNNYLHGINTIAALRTSFWKDTTNFKSRKDYFNRLVERGDYDSVLYQLSVITKMSDHWAEAREASKQYAYIRMNVEGRPEFVKQWIADLIKHKDDSTEVIQGFRDLLEFYQSRKKSDSIAVIYDQIFAFSKVRDSELLNNYAWDIANYSKEWNKALLLVNEALSLDPNNPDYLDTRAQINYSLKKYAEAISDEESAMYSADKSEDKDFFKERLDYYKKEFVKSKSVELSTPK